MVDRKPEEMNFNAIASPFAYCLMIVKAFSFLKSLFSRKAYGKP